jgi:epsilon-lactone hydrolase
LQEVSEAKGSYPSVMSKPPPTQLFPVNHEDIAPGRKLRTFFARFWSEPFTDMRSRYDEFIALTPPSEGVSFTQTTDPSPGWWAEVPGAPAGRAIVFIHGGGYGVGSAKAYRNFVSHLAALTKTNVFLLDYPLAPEACLPQALDMATAAIRRLQAGCKVSIVGDSAGGGMSLAATARLARTNAAPDAVVVFSPWTDLTLSGETMRSMAISDISLDPEYLKQCALQYIGARAYDDPDASPLFGIPAKMPPVLIQVGTDELLLDDSKRYAEAATVVGNTVNLEIYEGMHHVFVLSLAELAAARQAVQRAADFLVAAFSQ